MSQLDAERKSLEVLAEEFAARYRRGERPTLSEYIDAHPELAADIRELFPTLVMMEELAPSDSDSAAVTAETPHLLLRDYRILREIGCGGMGVVYEAEQLSLGRRVALKVLRNTGDATVRRRFHREACAAARLHHTNIVPVFEVGVDRDACWYAMQLILGQGLDQIIEELRHQRQYQSEEQPQLGQVTQAFVSGQFVCAAFGPATPDSSINHEPQASANALACGTRLNEESAAPLPCRSELSTVDSAGSSYFRSVARIGRQAAEALAHAHARGIIHRDVKPSNLLLDTAGVVWITDFGLAKTKENSLTNTGDVVGTLRYMSPERFKGESDERADVYGLGLTLYELLVLRPAFVERDRLQLIDLIKNQEPPRLRTLDQRIPRDLETIILKAIHKEAKRRYQSAESMAEDLRRFLANEPIKAKRSSHLARLRLWSRRHPALAALHVVLMLAVAASTAAAFYLRATLRESQANYHLAEKEKLEGKHKLWQSYLSQARAYRMSRQSGQRFDSLYAIKKALLLPVPPDHWRDELRSEAIAALCLPDLELAHEGGSPITGSRGFTIDDAFQRYAIADKDGKVSLRRLSDDGELLQLPGGGLVSEYGGLQFSPDGRFLHQSCQVQGGYRSRLWDLHSSPPRAVLDDEHCNLAFRPDSCQCATVYPDSTIRFFETASGRELRRYRIDGLPPNTGLAWNPKKPHLLLASHSSLRLLSVESGEVTALRLKPSIRFAWADWHPEGRLLAVSDDDWRIQLWDVSSDRKVVPPLVDHKNAGVVVKFNRAGDRLLSTDWSGNWHLWDTQSGRLLLTLPAHGATLYFSPDDHLVGSGGGGRVQLYHFRRGEELRTVVHRHTTGNRDRTRAGFIDHPLPIDSEGRMCALSINDYAQGVSLVDVARGEEIPLPLPGNGPTYFDREGALWTSGSAGLLRWPLAANPKTGERRYGPPQRIWPRIPARYKDKLRASADLRILAIPNGWDGSLVLHRDGGRQVQLGPQEDVRHCAISPDGRWLAAGSHHLQEGYGVKVWDIRTEKLVKDLPVGGNCGVRFSPDGKWLLTTSSGSRLWKVGSWEEGPSLPANSLNAWGAFTCDSKLLALGGENGIVRLIATETGAEIVRLNVPEQSRLSPCRFTPDGAQLLAVSPETTNLYLFDLRAIRAGLAELGLDWDALPYPAAPRVANAEPLSVHFDLGYLQHWAEADALVQQANQLTGRKEHAKALAALRKAVTIAPKHATAHNNLAWQLATGPKELRDPVQALAAARKAIELEPQQWMYHNTLGVALYRAGKLAEAAPVLERSLRESKGGGAAFDLFFLAMCRHRLGEAAKAKECHERGKQWFAKHKGRLSAQWVEELTAFQAESESVLAQPMGQAKK